MGTSDSHYALGTKLLAAGVAVAVGVEGVAAVSQTYTDVARMNMKQASGGDSILSGVNWPKGRRIGTSWRPTGTQTSASAVVRATGPAHIAENNMPPHVITPKKGSGIGASRAKRRDRVQGLFGVGSSPNPIPRRGSVLSWVDPRTGERRFARYVRFGGGSIGRKPFTGAYLEVTPGATKIYKTAQNLKLARIF